MLVRTEISRITSYKSDVVAKGRVETKKIGVERKRELGRIIVASALAGVLALPLAGQAFAVNGSRQPAGGAHMSSYVSDPHHDPRSLHSQRRGTGQILGAPLLSENAGVHGKHRDVSAPHWSSGFQSRPVSR